MCMYVNIRATEYHCVLELQCKAQDDQLLVCLTYSSDIGIIGYRCSWNVRNRAHPCPALIFLAFATKLAEVVHVVVLMP